MADQASSKQKKFPQCPKCGCPARVVVVRRARVRAVLNADGSIGKLISCSRDNEDVLGFECSAGPQHFWEDPTFFESESD